MHPAIRLIRLAIFAYRRVALVLVVGLAASAVCPMEARVQPLDYPEIQSVDTVDIYHGTRVADPYRWLEDQKSEATHQWVREQNGFTFRYLDQISEREQIQARLSQLWDYLRYEVPRREASRLFFNKNDGLQEHSVTYVRPYVRPTEGGGEARVLFNPNAWSEDGTVALSALAPGPKGRTSPTAGAKTAWIGRRCTCATSRLAAI